jgi:hypothetical protein
VRRSWLRSFWAGLIVVTAVAGYLVSSGFGERLLHDEIENQLTRLLRGPVEIEAVEVHFEGGLRLEIHRLEAFPSEFEAKGPAMRARRVVAWIDGLALLIGRLELSTLVMEGPFLRVEQDAGGRFPDLPLPVLAFAPVDENEETLSEEVVARIESLDAMAESLFESIRAADRIEILDGTVQWLRHRADPVKHPATEIRLELFSAVIERNWLSEDLSLEWSAVVVDGQHAPFPIGAIVERGGDETDFEWTVSMSQIPLEAAETPLGFIERIDGLSGQLTTALHLATAADGSRRLRVDGQVHDAIVGLKRSKSKLRRERVTLHAEIEIGEEQVVVHEAHFEGERLGFDLNGALTRPIRPNSIVRLESRMVGVELEDVFELARSLESEFEAADSFVRLTERVESGRILYIEAGGRARLRRWQDLFSGRVREIPDGFMLGGAFEDISVSTGPADQIEGLRGEIEWVNDHITLRDTSAQFRGEALPRMDLVLSGVRHLALASEEERQITTQPPPIPGLAPLLELIKPKDPNALPPVKAIGLEIEHLDHPIFRFPFRDLRVLIEPLRLGMDVQIRSGLWGGAEIRGDAHWSGRADDPSLTANLVLAAPATPASSTSAAPAPPSGDVLVDGVEREAHDEAVDPDEAIAEGVPETASAEERWGKGRFELEFRPRPTLPFLTAAGFFRLQGTRLLANEVQFRVEPVGQLAARIVLDLAEAERVGVELSLAATGTRLEHVEQFIGLPAGLSSGELRATGSLRGSIRPDRPLIEKLDGKVRAEAKDGRIRMAVPLLLRLSRASEGYNPFANEDRLRYETTTATIEFQQGALLAEDFEIEGPLRIYARGRIEPLADPSLVRGVVGIFLFRAPNQILESLPLVRYFLPGNERGLIGAYFDVKGALAEPKVETLPVDTLMTVVPNAIKAPFKVLQYLFDPSEDDS